MADPMTIRSVRWLAAALVLVALAASRPALSAPGEPIDGLTASRLSSHVLVDLSGPVPAEWAGRVARVFGDWYRLSPAAGESAAGLVTALRGHPAVNRVEPDYLVTADAVPDDPEYGRQWHMPQIQAEQAWGVTAGDGVVVAVIDTGVDPNGADGFCRPIAAWYDGVGEESYSGEPAESKRLDKNQHGTHVAGTVAGCANNGTGVVGVAPEAQIMAVKVLNRNGGGSLSAVAAGIVWAADNGADVINLSLGAGCGAAWPSCSSGIINDAIAHAAAEDVVIVASAGNNNRAYAGVPGNHPEVIAVSATRYDRNRASYSNYGPAIDLAAPGGQSSQDLNSDGYRDSVLQETFALRSDPKQWGYLYLSGTSMAAPHVAGVAALLRACAPEADREAVRAALEGFALDLGEPGFDPVYGNGFLQAHDALAGLTYGMGRDPANHCALTDDPPPCFTVTAGAAGPGTLAVTPPPNCDPDGGDPVDLSAYSFGTRLAFTASPDPGNEFTGWTGDLSGESPVISLRISRDLVVGAGFAPPPPEPSVAFSLKTNGTAAGLAYADEDVLLDAPGAALSRLFIGANYGLGRQDIDALAISEDGTLLISFDGNGKNLPGIGATAVDDSDIVRFDPVTALFAWYFDGSDVGLTTAAEDVDAIALLPGGRLLVSTSGKVNVPGVVAADEDILVFDGVLGTDATSGTWSLYLDGSDIAPALGDIDGLAWLPGGSAGLGVLVLSADAKVTLGGQTFLSGDLFACDAAALGSTSRCETITLFQPGSAVGLTPKANVDAVEVLLGE